ncbi:hypothetical protein F5B22DRAFT_647872 [Xylaria bambusicola]|uniref:uncharacterized protein n=1 Tax=Xylaria bambusicola TaxID=326684 RepID=UPI00200811B7|nr:uncharacterized protein F5B22DRAFT_647872 [Xylaria bambusicola]KAI0513322.1 hypothetical protein F5B22DRAFT_647872 [Xylaria bambusicola]
MLFDDEYNLTGIIDWSSAQAAPLEQLSVSPELFTFPALSDEENRPIVEFKKLVIESLTKIDEARGKKPPLDNPEFDMALISNQSPLSSYMASKSTEIAYWQYMSSPRAGLVDGKIIAKLLYGGNVTWEQLRGIYGSMPLF